MERTYIENIFSKEEGEQVLIKGWVYDKRDLKKIRFIVLRDITGRAQIVGINGETSPEIFEQMDKLNRESVVEIEGILRNSKQAPGGKEINPISLKVVSEAENPLPIDVSDYSKTELPLRLDNRFLDLHREKTQAIFKIQTEIAHAFREFFYKKEFVEIQPPLVIGASSEGGTDLFPVKYFEKSGYLAQSPQLYKQMVACSMEKTFTIGPAWRAEKHNTTRHINEIRMIDVEAAFYDQFQIMRLLEESTAFVIQNVISNRKKELELLGINDLKVPKGVYLSYEEAIKKVGGKLGEDFSPDDERKLCELYKGDIVFTHSWPTSIKPFYIMPKDENPESTESCGFDALYGGVEISSGGQRIHLPNILTKMIEKKGLNPESFKDYINSFRYGAPPHAGWAIGLERITQIVCGLDNIKEATMFPRDRDRLNP